MQNRYIKNYMDATSPLSDFLPYMLSVTSNAVSGRIALEYRSRFGLKVPEWRVMAVLGNAGAVTQRDLAALTLMDKVAVNRACKDLEERGLAWRQPNSKDGRSHLLELTDEGRRMYGGFLSTLLRKRSQGSRPCWCASSRKCAICMLRGSTAAITTDLFRRRI